MSTGRAADALRSCIYEGWVRHRRHAPAAHAFRYRLFMMQLDLTELPALFARRWLWSCDGFGLARFRRRDHLRGEAPAERDLADAARDLVQARLGRRPAGRIELLTHLEYFGYRFNPVSFYFCHDSADRIDAVIAEINNTPWGEQHCYVLDASTGRRGAALNFAFAKQFHISPFMEMRQWYRWRITPPDRRFAIHMENEQDGRSIFDATMVMTRREISGASLAGVLIRFPFMTARIIAAIYWQALRLRLKGVPYVPHSGPRSAAAREA